MIVTMLLNFTERAITCVRESKRRSVGVSIAMTVIGIGSLCFWIGAILSPEFIHYMMRLFGG